MEQIFANILLSNPVKTELDSMETASLVDTGALLLHIPKYLAIR
ncbi:MAG: hypothetical protein WCO37_02015 [Bacteroidota bacterium]